MLMEPDEYTSQERALTDKAKELICSPLTYTGQICPGSF